MIIYYFMILYDLYTEILEDSYSSRALLAYFLLIYMWVLSLFEVFFGAFARMLVLCVWVLRFRKCTDHRCVVMHVGLNLCLFVKCM